MYVYAIVWKYGVPKSIGYSFFSRVKIAIWQVYHGIPHFQTRLNNILFMTYSTYVTHIYIYSMF